MTCLHIIFALPVLFKKIIIFGTHLQQYHEKRFFSSYGNIKVTNGILFS